MSIVIGVVFFINEVIDHFIYHFDKQTTNHLPNLFSFQFIIIIFKNIMWLVGR
jgi:hypothetical protein